MLVSRLGPRAFLVTAAAPVAAFVWALVARSSLSDDEALTESWSWVPELGLELSSAQELVAHAARSMQHFDGHPATEERIQSPVHPGVPSPAELRLDLVLQELGAAAERALLTGSHADLPLLAGRHAHEPTGRYSGAQRVGAACRSSSGVDCAYIGTEAA